MLPNVTADTSEKSTYQKWVVTEGIPIIRDFYVVQLYNATLGLVK